MRYEIRSIGLWSTIKIWFPLNLIVGFGLGFLWVIIGLLANPLMLAAGMPGAEQIIPRGESAGMVLIWMGLISAFMHGVIGTILLVGLSVLYNIGARLIGGWEITLDPVDTPSAEAPPTVPLPTRSQERPSVPPIAVAPSSPDIPPPPPPVDGDRGPEHQGMPTAPSVSEVPGWTGAWPREETVSIPEPPEPPAPPDTHDKKDKSL